MDQENLIVVDLDLEFMVGLDQVRTILHEYPLSIHLQVQGAIKTELYRIEHLQIG